MSTHRLIQLAAAGIVCAGAYLVISTADPAGANETDKVQPEAKASTPEKKPISLKGDAAKAVAKPEKKPEAKSNRWLLPDGTTVPVLNGAFGAPAMGWPEDRPWSPIIDKETDDDGIEWYVHQDGSKSTTRNVYQSHIGGIGPISTVANPAKVVPMDPSELKREQEREEREARRKAKDAKKKADPKKK